MILIIDFGSQTCHLIGRRIRDLGVKIQIVDPEAAIKSIKKTKPSGIIFSGGPASVYEKGAPTIDRRIFELNIPILGICYGWQLTAHILGGKVIPSHKEYGPANLKLQFNQPLFTNVNSNSKVWLSHGDTVVKLPIGFRVVARTENVKIASAYDSKKNIFGVQFHPEVDHTVFGKQILENFVKDICFLIIKRKEISIKQLIDKIKKTVGKEKVVCAVSGGVDSTTTAALIAKAVGKNLYPVYIESGLMRIGTQDEVKQIFTEIFKIKPIIVDARQEFMKSLKGITDPEEKRKIIGALYIKLFEKEAKKIKAVKYLAQGTIYSDVIESKGTKKADKIKSHHNVGGLPEKMHLQLIEPLRDFYKDEVRQIALKLGLPKNVVYKQVFPGPGQAIRIIGEVNQERLKKQQAADKIVMEEITRNGLYEKVFMSFAILTNTKSTAVKGDARRLDEVIAVRIVESKDIMTTDWAKLPYEILQKISSRIINEVPNVSRVVYDITTKPPATMEWE